ncbi:hypothetical protein B0H67DRAFT_670301 [Lasiosphaeris hirsuta]|uniref:Uncharacterized protein n=1 Tax=Lasiosphaeris hirsuta TaxID=260670 RepID=A0AA40DL94_9PEZI|nr:hypothetical protein B0H67DRAFT_670301 [Lasiosphaeris hirsuta]
MGINFSNPVCEVDQCLNQVIGQANGLNGPAHYSACVSYFGPPIIASETPPVSIFTSFATETVQYTSVVVETSTAYSTSDSTSTLYTQVVETASAYSATAVETATVTIAPDKKRRNRKRSPCKPSIPPSAVPSTIASTTTPSWWPLASNCPTLEDYESACACIYAVSTATRTNTLVPLVSTVVATNTVSSLVESTATSVVNTVVINTVATVATSTFVSTTTGIYQTTTTVTEIAEPVQTRTILLEITHQAGALFARIDANKFLSYEPSSAGSSSGAVQVKFVPSGEQPSLAGYPAFKLVLASLGADYGLLRFEEDSSSPAVTWGVVSEKAGEPVTFASADTGYDTSYTCGDGFIYLAGPNWIDEPEQEEQAEEGGQGTGPANPCFHINFEIPSNQR